VARIRRHLTGIGAPADLHGPSRIGSSQSPAAADQGITEDTHPGNAAIAAGSTVFPGGSWYAVDGWLTWALGELDGKVAGARPLAFSERERNTLAAHAHAYPRHWDGTISVDDVCDAFYSPPPIDCGAGLTTAYAGQIMHQPARSLFDAIKLAGIDPTAAGGRRVRGVVHHGLLTFVRRTRAHRRVSWRISVEAGRSYRSIRSAFDAREARFLTHS
jgi:hypothetical protein